MKLWHILAVVGAGIAYGWIAPGQFEHSFGHVMLYVFLPPLLFEGAWNSNYRAIVRQWRTIATLAVPGVAITAAIVAGALVVINVPFSYGLVAGAILSATDPIAVIAVFKRLSVPGTLATIVECEALMNDATAVVLYGASLAFVASGRDVAAIAPVIAMSVFAAIAGVAIGIGIAFVAARVLRRRASDTVQIGSTIVCAFGSYLIANALSLSGVFAVVACGIALRYFERRWIALSIASDVSRFWDVAAVVCNVLVFFLVGAALPLSHLTRYPAFIIAVLLAVVASRWIITSFFGVAGFPKTWLPVVRCAGMRGALSLALALALPMGFAYREGIIDATFAAALFTLALGGPLAAHFATFATRRPVVQRRSG